MEVEGFKLVNGRGTRKVTSQDDVEKVLDGIVDKDELYENKPIGVPAIEKLIASKGLKPTQRAELMEQFVIETIGKPSVKRV